MFTVKHSTEYVAFAVQYGKEKYKNKNLKTVCGLLSYISFCTIKK